MREAEPHSYQDYLKYFTEHTPRNINYLKIKNPTRLRRDSVR